MTRFPELFKDLARPFPQAGEYPAKILPKAGGKPYVTARQVMNRLDSVLGPERWSDEYTSIGRHNSVMCRLTIVLPDGTMLTKCDAGGAAGIDDEGDDDKSAYSYALKRAAVKFGIARELYSDGVADLDQVVWTAVNLGPGDPVLLSTFTPTPNTVVMQPDGPPPSNPTRPLASFPQPANGKALYAWACSASDSLGIDMIGKIQDWVKTRPDLDLSADWSTWDIGAVTDCHLAMAQYLISVGLLVLPPEARAQMAEKHPVSPKAHPGPLTIEPRDPHQKIKVQIKETAKRLYQAAFQQPPSEPQVMEYIQTRCKEHKIIVPDSIRNLSVHEHLYIILKSLQDDECEMRLF